MDMGIWSFDWLGEKYDDLLTRKNANICKGEEVEKREKKWEIFTVLWRKNIIVEEGGAAKISYFGQIYTPEQNCKESAWN